MRNLGKLLYVLSALTLAQCAGNGPEIGGDLLEPVSSTEAPSPTPVTSPAYEKLVALLQSLGCEGVGLQFESDEMLALLQSVFADPKVQRRQLKTLYTGQEMSYDKKAKSLTVGKADNATTIIRFISKNVPLIR